MGRVLRVRFGRMSLRGIVAPICIPSHVIGGTSQVMKPYLLTAVRQSYYIKNSIMILFRDTIPLLPVALTVWVAASLKKHCQAEQPDNLKKLRLARMSEPLAQK